MKSALKRIVIGTFGYPRFLSLTFHYRVVTEHLRRRTSEFFSIATKLKSGSVILDIGANIGYASAIFASSSPDAIYAFEPDPENFECLKNVSTRYPKIHPICAAIGAFDGFCKVHPITIDGVRQHALSKVQADGNAAREAQTTMRSVDSVRLELNRRIHFIKIDVEGFEVDVLRGMQTTLKSDHPILYVEICGRESINEYNQLLTQEYSIQKWSYNRFISTSTITTNGNYIFFPTNDVPDF